MTRWTRRSFFRLGAAMGGLGVAARHGLSLPEATSKRVVMSGDGLSLSPPEQLSLLEHLGDIAPDVYGHGGVVETMETFFAESLGKEAAMFFPTGTLANHLALRALCGEKKRAIVPAESHVYNDASDGAQALSGLNLIPIAEGRTSFEEQDLARAIDRTSRGYRPLPLGAILVESPMRRCDGAIASTDSLQRVATRARELGLGTHLDGARLYAAAPYSERTVAQTASYFDTVYVSLYKCFNAPFGAVLAGPRSLLAPLDHVRRSFGATIYQAWPAAAMALHFVKGFEDRFGQARERSERFIHALQSSERFVIDRVPNGSNVFFMTPKTKDARSLGHALRENQIAMSSPDANGRLRLQVNETWNYRDPDELADAFLGASR